MRGRTRAVERPAPPRIAGETGRAADQRRSPGWRIAAGLIVLAVLCYLLRYILLPFAFAAAAAFVTDPLVLRLRRWLRAPRWVAALPVFIAIVALAGGVLVWLGSLVLADLVRLVAETPTIVGTTMREALGSSHVEVLGRSLDADALSQEVLAGIKTMVDASGIAIFVASSLAAIFGAFLALVLTLYFLVDGERLTAGALWLVAPAHRSSVQALVHTVAPVLRRYTIGVMLVVTYTSLVAWIGFGPIFQLPFAVLLAVSVGVLELIPVIGPLASASIVAVVAFQQHTTWAVVGLVTFTLALRLSIDQVAGPILLGRAVRLHPVVIIFAMLSGGVLFGVIGILLAVPVAASLKAILADYYGEAERAAPSQPGD